MLHPELCGHRSRDCPSSSAPPTLSPRKNISFPQKYFLRCNQKILQNGEISMKKKILLNHRFIICPWPPFMIEQRGKGCRIIQLGMRGVWSHCWHSATFQMVLSIEITEQTEQIKGKSESRRLCFMSLCCVSSSFKGYSGLGVVS